MTTLTSDEIWHYEELIRDYSTSQVERNNARVALMYGPERGVITEAQWTRIKRYAGHMCVCCGCHQCKLTIDHVLPLSMDGKNTAGNCQPLCERCNKAKGDKHIDYRRWR